MKKHNRQWKYLYGNIRIKTGRYLCYKESEQTSERFFLDAYIGKRGWLFKHPAESYTAIIKIDAADIDWKDGVPDEYGWYLIQNEGKDNMWIDYYGKDYFSGLVDWKFHHFPIARWGNFPFIDSLSLVKYETAKS
jgi:hypothetical protein